jgi:hypothetical protein
MVHLDNQWWWGRGNPLFFPLFCLFVPFTHGRSHRFKSCIAHHLISFNIIRIEIPVIFIFPKDFLVALHLNMS